MKVGDQVRIKPESKPYFSSYAGTEAIIVKCYEDSDVVEIKTYDSKIYMSAASYLELLLPEIPFEDDFATADLSCQHTNTYKNIISNNLRFLVCSDCGKDLGDI